jgi:NAD dependent epimerase/dehydratase family enzyme
MSVAEDTTQVPTTIAKIDVDNTAVLVAAVVNDLTSTISNTLEAPLKLVSETPKLVESATKAIVDKIEEVVEKATKDIVDKSKVVVDKTTKIVEQTTKDILKESQSVIDETTKLIDNITSVIAGKNDLIMNASTNIIADEATKAIMSEGQAIVDETTKLVAKTAENIANMVSEEEKRLTETISRLSIDMEQEAKKASGLFTKIHNFVKLIMSCIHRADKSVVKVSTADVDIKVANVV